MPLHIPSSPPHRQTSPRSLSLRASAGRVAPCKCDGMLGMFESTRSSTTPPANGSSAQNGVFFFHPSSFPLARPTDGAAAHLPPKPDCYPSTLARQENLREHDHLAIMRCKADTPPGGKPQ